jgi:hypothetical protein
MTEIPNNSDQQSPWDGAPPPPRQIPLPGEGPVIGAEADTAPADDDVYGGGDTTVIGSGYDDESELSQGARSIPAATERATGRAAVDGAHDTRLPARRPSPYPTRQTVEGELLPHGREYQGTREQVRGDPTRPFATEVLGEEKLVITGGGVSERTRVADRVVNQVAREVSESGGGVVWRVRFKRADEPAERAAAVDASVANAVELPVTDPRGGPCLTNSLTNRQLGEAFGNAIAGDDTRAAGAYAEIIESLADSLDGHNEREFNEGRAEELKKKTLEDIASAVNEYREMRDDATMSDGRREVELDDETLESVRDAIADPRKQTLKQYFEPLGAGLDKITRDVAVDREPRHAVVPPGASYQNKNTTVLGVTIDGYGRRMAAEGKILSNAMLPLIAEPNGWGRPRAIVVEDADLADQLALEEMARHAEGQVPMVWTIAKPNERNAHLLDAPAHLILKAEARPATQVSNTLGTKPGREVQSISESVTGGSSTGAHIGQNTGYREGSHSGDEAETGGSTRSADDALNVGHTYTETVVFDVPVLKPTEITGLGKKDVVARRGNEITGVYDTDSGGYVAPYPPPRPRPTIGAQARINEIEQQNNRAKFLARKAFDEAQAARVAAERAQQEALAARSTADAALERAEQPAAIERGETQSGKDFVNGRDFEGMPAMPGKPEQVSTGPKVRPGAEEQYRRMQYRDETKRTVRGDGKRDDNYQAWKAVNLAYGEYVREARQNGQRPVSWAQFRLHNLGY